MDDIVNVNFDSELSKQGQQDCNPETILTIKKDLNQLFDM